jgi:hypothetical protein
VAFSFLHLESNIETLNKIYMSHKAPADNIYKEGTFITAKEDPDVQLVITKYMQRIYYCAVVGNAERKELAYFERELIAPATA